jgi:hypothetical protein
MQNPGEFWFGRCSLDGTPGGIGVKALVDGSRRSYANFPNQREGCDMLQHHKVIGGGGVQLHAVETGNPKGRPIVFIAWGIKRSVLDRRGKLFHVRVD